MSRRRDTALQNPPCGVMPRPGMPLIVGQGNALSATTQLRGDGIQNETITLGHMVGGVRDVIFGGGFDAEADFDGTSTVQGLTPSGNVYTMTRDLVCTRINVRAGVTLKPSGYVIKCRELHLWGSAIISRDGTDGGAATVPVAGVKAAQASDAIVGGSGDGGNGGQGGETASEAGDPGQAGGVSAGSGVYYGGDGGSGAAGTASGGAGGAAGAGQSASTSLTASTTHLGNLDRLIAGLTFIRGGAGGGGGGGGGATAGAADGGGGGGGGAGGGVVLILAERIILNSWTGRISANGGTGGAGANSATAGDGGSGGGGGGGFVQVVYLSVEGGSLAASPATRFGATTGGNVQALAGAGGTGFGGVGPGSAGDSGYVVLLDLGASYVPPAERPPRPTVARPFYSAAHLHPGHTRRRP